MSKPKTCKTSSRLNVLMNLEWRSLVSVPHKEMFVHSFTWGAEGWRRWWCPAGACKPSQSGNRVQRLWWGPAGRTAAGEGLSDWTAGPPLPPGCFYLLLRRDWWSQAVALSKPPGWKGSVHWNYSEKREIAMWVCLKHLNGKYKRTKNRALGSTTTEWGWRWQIIPQQKNTNKEGSEPLLYNTRQHYLLSFVYILNIRRHRKVDKDVI